MKKFYQYRLVWPALFLYSVFFVIPAIIGIGYSFTDWSTFHNSVSFVGLDNFVKIFQDRELSRSLVNTLYRQDKLSYDNLSTARYLPQQYYT